MAHRLCCEMHGVVMIDLPPMHPTAHTHECYCYLGQACRNPLVIVDPLLCMLSILSLLKQATYRRCLHFKTSTGPEYSVNYKLHIGIVFTTSRDCAYDVIKLYSLVL